MYKESIECKNLPTPLTDRLAVGGYGLCNCISAKVDTAELKCFLLLHSSKNDVVVDADIVEVMEVPERPEGPLEIFNVTDTRAQLQWYPPRDAGGGTIIGYIIDARELDKIDIISHLELVPPTCTSAVIEGLETGQLYQFRVYSENAVGMSDALIGPRSVRIQAGIARPSCPGVPVVIPRQGGDAFQQLAYSNKPDDAVILQWAAPYTDGGTPVNGYAVERKAGENGQWVRAHPLDVRETEVALTGLQPGQDYRFRVKASNAIGCSEPGSESESYLVPYDPSNVVRPSFTVGLRDAIVMEHEKVEFVVEVQGIPPPEVQWIVNGSTDSKVIVTDRDPDSGVSTLIVNDVLAGDEGEVKCIATNEAGQSTSIAILSVEAPPRAVLTKKYEDGLIFEEGDIIRLKVEFTGRPRPEITWYHENKRLAPDGRMEIEIMADCTILKVAQAKRSDRGEYSVKLQSGLGEDSASFLVTVANRPSVPGKPQPTDVLESVVSLQWDPSEDDGGCEISCYIVEYNRLGWDMWLKAATSRTPQIRLGDLIPGSTYLFRIKAENPYGVSEPSAQSDLIRLPARSNETSWVPDMTSSELVDPDDTTISSSNLGPRDSDQQVTRSGDFDYLPLDASELELGRLTNPSILGAPPAFEVMGGVALMSEPPDRPGQVELDPRYAFSASAVLEKMAAPVTVSSLPGFTSNDVLSGIGSSSSRNSSSPSVSPERPSLEDALSLDDDSSQGSSHDVAVQQLEVVEQPIQQRGFLLPRSPARLFVHNAIVQSALSSVASSTAPLTLPDVLEQVTVDDAVADSQPSTLDQIEQDLEDQLQVLDQIELDICEGKAAVQNEVGQSDKEMSSSDQTDQMLLEQETVMEQIKPSDQLTLMEQHVEPSHDMMESTVAKEIEPAVDVPTILLQEEEMHHDVPVQSHLAAIDSGLCELMAHRGSDGEGQHTDQYSDAYITAVDSMSSCDYGDSPEPDGLVLDRHPKGECPSPPISSKPITEMDADDAAIGTDERPIFLRCVTDQTVKVGTRARFLAEIVSSSSLAVTWFFNGLPVFQPAETAHGRFKILQEGNFYCLEISPVALEDEGAWTCRAVLAETFGSQEGVSATAQLRVMVPKSYKRPEFVEDLQAILTEEGTVSLECKVVGIPTPVLHWFKDGKEIKAGDVFAFRAPQSDSTAEETATSLGLYACEAINCIGKAVSTSQVRVKNAVQQPTPSQSRCESAGPPVIIEEPFNQKIRVGEDVRFSVRVMVPPKPVQVKWFNKDVPKEASSKYVVGEDGHGGYSLDISPTDINDDGEWKVAIKNEGVDAESSASAVLTLVVPKNYRPPRFLESLKAILTEEGLVSFECKVVGFPTPQLQWFKDGQELKPGDVYQLSGTNSLGSYSCVARNCMGTAISAAELTVDDIQNQLNEEERLQLMDSHRPPVFAQGLRSSESRVGDPLRLTVQVSSTTDNFLVTWFHNDEPIDLDETHKYRSLKEEAGLCHLDVEPLEFSDEGDWKCIVINDFGHAVTSCSVKLTVPRFFRKPHFLEPLRAVLSDEGTVNLECKVIGVPQPSLKWYKDGVELKPGDIHRIMSGQDGTCCLGTYTCEAHNCMGTSSSSAALLGFEDRPEAEQNAALAHDEALLDAEPRGYVTEHPRIARNPSLSTIQEERSSQISLYETANAEDTLTEERAEISVSLDGREVSVSLYETPDLTEEEAQQIVELFAEELSERISYRNTTELPPLRFTRETATSGSLLMEAVVIDVPMEINGSADFSLERTLSEVSFEEAPTEADIEELSAMEALIIEEADQRNDPYFLDDLTIPDLPYEVNDVRRSITGLQEALLVQETCLSDRERPLHLESHSGGATPIVMSPRRLSVEHEQLRVLDDYQIISADGIQSPVDADYYSPLEYSDSCSVLLTSPKTDSPGQEALCVATPTVQQQPAVVDQPVVMATPLSDFAATVPADVPQSAAKGRIESLIVSNKSSLDIRESADETETSADENSQRRASVVEAPPCASLEREMQTTSNELEQAEEAGAIPLIETGQSNSVLVESALSAVHLESDQTSGADEVESGAEGDPSALMPSDGRIQVTEQQEDATCVEECWNEASRLAAAVDTVMDEASVDDHGVELEQYPSTSSASDAGRLLGSGQEDDTKGQSFDTVRDEQEILSSADAAHPSPAIGEAAHQGSHSNVQVTDATTGSKVEQTSAASSPIIAEQCGDVPLPFQEVDDCATKEVGAAAELLGNVTIDTPIAITESEESCATRQFEVKSDDEPVIRGESAAAEEKELEIETATGKAEEEAALVGLIQKDIEGLCLQKDAGDENRIEKDVGGPQVLADDAKEANQVETDVKLQQVASKKEIMQEAGEQKDVEKIESVEPEEISKLGDEQRQIQEESNQSESGDKDVEAHTDDVEIIAPQKEAKEDEQFSEEAERREPSPLPAEEKEHVNKEVERQDEQMKDEEKQTVLNVEDIQETMDARERLSDAAEKEAQEKELVVKEAEAKERIMKDIEETERKRKEADEKEMLQRQAEEEERLLKETEEKERLLKEAEEKERLIEEAKEAERLQEEAAEQERLLKEADERERAKREAEEQELRAKEAEEQERLLRDAEEKECRLKEAEERERLVKEAEESERLRKEAEEKERLRKEAEETERLRLEAEEIERLHKEAEENERLRKEAEENERLRKEAEETERLRKEAEENERLRKEAEENERLRREAEENERLQKEIEEKERLVKEAEETERVKKEAEEKERHKKEIEEKERLAKEAEEQECRLKEAEEKERLRIEAEEQSRLRQEAEQEERLLKEAEEKERALKEAEEKERALKEAEEKERALKEAEDKERALKEAEEKERLLKESEEKERLKIEAEASERLLKEAKEKERLIQEAEEKERFIQEAKENERLLKEAEEKERSIKIAEEKERLVKEAEEQERLLKEAEENDSRTKEAEERERLTKEAEQTEPIKKDSEERELLQEAVEQASLAVEADEMERLKQEAGRNEGLPKDSAPNAAEEKEVNGQGIPAEETNRKQEPIEGSARVESQQISGRPEATTSSFLSSGALRSMDASLPRRSETSHLMTEKPSGRTESQLLESSTSLIESSLTEDELIAKQIEEEKLKRRREAAERLVREQEREASGQTEDDVAARRREERLRLEQCELHQTVDEHIRKQQQQEEVIQRESEEEKIRLQKQKEEERRLKLEEAEKLRREVEVQERQRREEKEAKRLEAERIRREEEAQEWMLKERERLRLEEEIERLESERLRMKEERRLRQAKEEEEERLRVKKEREERLRREQEEEERLRREEEEQLRLMKEERERARKQKEEEEERMLREIEERAQKKKEENERLRKEKEEEERRKKEEERLRREDEERKRAEAAEKLRREAEEKMREKEEKRTKQEEERKKRTKQEEERKKRDEEDKRMKEELRKQKEEEAKQMMQEQEAARIKRAEEQKMAVAPEEETAERCVKQTEAIQQAAASRKPTANEAGLDQSKQDERSDTPDERSDALDERSAEVKLRERRRDEDCEREAALVRKQDDSQRKEPEAKTEEEEPKVDDEMMRQKVREEKELKEIEKEEERSEAEAKAVMEQQERKKAEQEKLEEQQQEKERQAAAAEKRNEEEKQRREAEEKRKKEQEEKERKEAEQKKLKELREAEEIQLKEQRQKEAEEKRLKDQAEKERKEREEKELKEKQEAEQRKLKELQEAEEKKLKEEAEKERREREDKESKEKERKEAEAKKLQEEKERKEAEAREKKQQEKKLKEAEELKKKERQEAEEKKLKEQKEKERQEAEEKKLKERKEAEEKELKEQEEKKLKKERERERQEAQELQLKEQQEKEERKERKKKDKLEKERKEMEQKQTKEQQELTKKAEEDERMKSSLKTGERKEPRVKAEEERPEREAGRHVDDARNRSDEVSPNKERRRRPITNSDEQQQPTLESCCDNSTRTTRPRARPADESQFDAAAVGSATTRRRPAVPTVFEEAACDSMNPSWQQPGIDGSWQTHNRHLQLSTDFDLHPATRLSREDVRHGIRARSAGVASHSMLNRSAYRAESHSTQPEWDSSTQTNEDGRRDPTKKPKFSSKLRDMEVAKGCQIKLTCSLLCNPEPEIEWFRNGLPILKCEDRHRYATSWNPIGIASLEVRDVTRSDTGEYMCVARNQHGQASTSADVRVRGDYEPKTSSPSFTSSIRDVYHETSDELVLECAVDGFPTPKITWMKDGIKLHLSSRYKHSLDMDGRCRLVVHSPCVGDSGHYTCVAQNASRKDEISSFVVVPEHVWNSNEKRMKTAPSHAGYSGSAEFYRRQAERDKIASSADGHSFDAGRYDAMAVPDDSAHFVLLPESTLTVGRDRDLVIQCRVRGHPRPKVTWLKGIRDVAESGRSCVEMDGDLYRFVLKKANYGDGGTYIVKASNCHGTQKAYCTVRVKEATNSSEWDFKDAETSLNDLSERRVRRFNKDVPGPVAAPPMATVSGKNVVSLSWPKPNYTGGAPILAYKVEAWLLGEGAIWIEVAMTCITSTDVYNLKPEREYLFRITPRNKYGWGESLVSSTPIQTVSRTGLPHFHRQLHPQIKALEHTDVELLTEVSGQPTPLVEWYRDGSKLDGVKQPRYELRSIGSDCRHALTIHDVQMETDDDSKFTCEAVNPAGRVATFSRVLVVTDQRVAEADALFRQQLDGLSGNDRMAMAPQFTMRPRDRRVQLTFPVRLTCQVIGCPKPDVTWYHNDSAIIIGDDERHSYSVDGNFHTLEIAATKFDDAGIYSVQGRNCSGAVGCQCCLVVDGGIRAYVMPFFTHELEDRTVSEGGTFSLIARVEAYPAVGVLWHRDGIRLRPCRQYDMRLESDGTVALVVSGVLARRHAGVYTCTVTNEMGQVSSNARVTIRQRPLAIPSSSLDAISSDHDNIGETSVAPRFVQKPTEFVEGDALVVVCEVLGDPKPEVIWLRDWLNPPGCQHADRFVSEADAPVYKLTVPCVQLDFSATYSVVARNLHGEAKAAISLQVYVHGGQGRQGSSESVGSSASVGRSTTFSRVLAAPTVVQPLRHLRCCDGDTVTFECRFNGQPETAGSIQIHWLRGGKLLRLCKDFSAELKAEEGVVRLSIRRVYPEDEGEYTCVAYNELGSDSTSACLIVDVADDKENDLMVQLDSRPAGTVSARATPRTTPSRTIRSVSPINSTATQQQQQQQQQKSRVRKVPPKFYSVPHNKIAETGETVRFQCNVGGNPSPRVTWDRDNIAIKPETIAPAGRVSIEERDDVRVLEIRNVTSEDAGLYRITVENELGRIQANARLDILSRSSGSRSSGFIRSGSAASAGRGAYYSPLSGSSASRLAGRALGMSSASYLRGSSTPRSGGGRYHATSDMDGSSGDCVAAKSKASNQQPVSFVQQLPSRMRVNEGDAVELQVVITGTPPLKVVWVQNDAILADCPEFRHLDYGDGRYALRLSDAFTHDSGVYFCEAYNRHGEAESWCRLIVSDPTDKLFTETSAEASTTLAYSSANTASVRTQNDEEEEDNNQTVNAIDDRLADYRDDEDVFRCSKEDLTYESDNKLNDELDNPFQVAAQIVKGPVSVSTLVGSTVLLEALIIGRPEPTVRWLKGGKELAESERVEMRQADGMASLSLHRITADDSGKYIVMAENTFGMDCHYASLAVEGPPDPGGKPTICEVKADSLTLTWYGSVYDGGSVITGYLVEICETGQSWTVLTSECNSTSYVIHGLAPLRTYQFRVRAKNIHGCSEPSSPSDPLFLQPPSVVEKRDKAVVNIEREEKDHQTMVGQADDDQVDYDRDDDDESHAPQFEHCHVTVQPGEPHFQEKYSVHEELGKGRFGVVYRLVDRASGALRAAKYVRCIKAADREKVYQEVAVMNKLQHPKLLQLAAAYDCPKEIVLVTEYISGGELFERVVADDFTLTERDCILFMRQICEGVGYMHSKSIVHLDLKPENILCQSPNSHRIKLIDFGLARQLDPDQPVRVLFGTPEFIAPEIVSYEPIGCATDMWSLGVVCYVLLSGLSPFMGDNDADTFANITSSDYDFDDDAFAAISCDAKDFISSLLVKRPELRLSAEACLQHQWLAQAKHAMNSIKLPTDRLKKFIIRRKWQKTGTAIRALGRMASLSSASRRNSSSSSTGRRTSRMDSLCEEEQGSVFSSGSSSRFATSSLTAPTNGADPVTRIRSPSLPVVTHPCQSPGSSPGIARSRSPSLPATGPAIELPDRSPPATISVNNSPRRVYYADRSDSGISDCSNHSSTLLSGSHMPTLIQEEEDDEHCGTESALTNGCSSSDRFTGGTFLAQKSAGHSGQHALQGKGVVSSRHSVDSAIDAE